MHAAADRLQFAPPPPPGLLRSFGLAVVAHLLLLLALIYGFHWQREAPQDAVEAELWSSVPQQAAPKPEPTPPAPPPPPPQPVVKPPPPAPPVNRDAEIALERERQQKALEAKERQQQLARERALRAKLEAQKKHEQELAQQRAEELAQKKLQEQKLADAKRKEAEEKKRKQQEREQREAKLREDLRKETMARLTAAAGTGAPNATGNATRSAGPSGSWAGKVQARVRPNIVFTDDVSGNPEALVRVRLGPGGMILGKPLLVKSSGSKAWDDAVVRALERTESLPPDTDGRYPSPVEIAFKPKS
ncbi:cell envelope integrity protein TolA [Ramlibacter ginsenosidimutans]|uniref:Cell envelope integrity protein TolA n=1 Tax=Ramlibacter ginsenosidimutans TaxID=502333 RepID=A0A934TW38_9BURK|nr:cell envelope integrity protein TolA [Ramlibacter ginsenosidimutans]MBK6008498.1 cell envelope integrity protein TolA [Ramlibacter ginsenosidimutans]